MVTLEDACGRTLTSCHTITDDIGNSGDHWVNHAIVKRANWVTGRPPSGLPAFIRGVIALFSRSAAAAHR
jgi:protease I